MRLSATITRVFFVKQKMFSNVLGALLFMLTRKIIKTYGEVNVKLSWQMILKVTFSKVQYKRRVFIFRTPLFLVLQLNPILREILENIQITFWYKTPGSSIQYILLMQTFHPALYWFKVTLTPRHVACLQPLPSQRRTWTEKPNHDSVMARLWKS